MSLWEDPQAYIRNSTVFAIDSLHTPLLLEEGDADGNVNPFQSQEVYNFGRRLGKNVVYLMYEGENHNVARPESQADYTKRQLEWFGHYLKGETAGAVDHRGRDLRRSAADPEADRRHGRSGPGRSGDGASAVSLCSTPLRVGKRRRRHTGAASCSMVVLVRRMSSKR